jgi:2-polyprenyl-3-methyl-5-hydroxy-6-metoxy-1,4-benzoquinol methylase
MQAPEWFQHILKNDHPLKLINEVWVDDHVVDLSKQWSFSQEWKEHKDKQQENTWVWNTRERLAQFFIETNTSKESIADKIILDAGCGNGLLTKAIAEHNCNVLGIDIHPYLPASTDNCVFVQGSFDDPPFKKESFDIIIANGSIHHTRSTEHSFQSLASLVKERGTLYVWVYKKPEVFWQKILLGIVDMKRFFISRSPVWLQKIFVHIITQFFFLLSRIRKGGNSNRTREEILINNYDTFTPRHRHYHTPTEVASWFHTAGFEAPILSHWNNKYGFGMMAIKNKNRSEAPGLSFGKN